MTTFGGEHDMAAAKGVSLIHRRDTLACQILNALGDLGKSVIPVRNANGDISEMGVQSKTLSVYSGMDSKYFLGDGRARSYWGSSR